MTTEESLENFTLDGERAGQVEGAQVDHMTVMLRRKIAHLEHENEELKNALFGLSHDLKEPARNASLTLGILARQLTGRLDEKDLTLMSAALQSTAAMNRLLDSMLTYAQAGVGIKLAEHAIKELVAIACDNLAFTIRDTQAKVLIGNLPSIPCDRSQVVRLFQNLISNAIKYRRESLSPEIEISAERGGSTWIFRVHDNGIGFDPSQSRRIFELFSRLRKNKAAGSGIGLPLCRKIVESHGGSIWAESEPGRGSSFFFTLRALTNEPLVEGSARG